MCSRQVSFELQHLRQENRELRAVQSDMLQSGQLMQNLHARTSELAKDLADAQHRLEASEAVMGPPSACGAAAHVRFGA